MIVSVDVFIWVLRMVNIREFWLSSVLYSCSYKQEIPLKFHGVKCVNFKTKFKEKQVKFIQKRSS